ncbi:MAG: hypothetical protein EXR09_11260 [Acetobacteraceae bacterium]|nr:hypothetical protein [Acetobacteraceae bacterium]
MATHIPDQHIDAPIRRGMRNEKVSEPLAPVIDAHFHHRRRDIGQFAVPFDLAQGGDHGFGIFCRLHQTGISQESADV